MAGHSKWNNIKRKKEKTDSQRAKIFTKIGREISVAVREGGADPDGNGKLRDIIAKAKANNVPNDNIERIIKKASGDASADNFENTVYEGYGPSGVAVIAEALTDNRNRTAGDVRHYFDKYGGKMGQQGSVMFMFSRQGIIIIEKDGIDEEKFLEDALEAGASDFNTDLDDVFEVVTEPNDFSAVRDYLEEKGYTFMSAELEFVPSTYTKLTEPDDIKNMGKMLEMFEDNDDIQSVWHNWENEEDYE
jgi:YebC/PmpR family DNA-binding regulatory protein